MFSQLKVFVLVALFTQICVGDEIAAYCDVVRLVDPETKCPEGVECTTKTVELVPGLAGRCEGGHFTSLKASSLGLTQIPESMNNMTFLQTLNIADNQITELPVLDQLTALTTIYMHQNKIKNFTGVFVNSGSVTYISASDNELVELPPELATMSSLETLLVANNKITELPPEYANLKNLNRVDIKGNEFHCEDVWSNFSGTPFASSCLAPQQRTDDIYPELPLDYSGDPTTAGLDDYEIAAIVLACVFVVLLVVLIIAYVMYRRKSVA